MRRRELLLLLGGTTAVACPLLAQQRAMPVIGILSTASPGAFAPYVAALRQGLNERLCRGTERGDRIPRGEGPL
jgi:hypothetical protein